MTALEELEPKISEAAQLMEMLSQPVRLKILCLLLEGERSVLQLPNPPAFPSLPCRITCANCAIPISSRPAAAPRPSTIP